MIDYRWFGFYLFGPFKRAIFLFIRRLRSATFCLICACGIICIIILQVGSRNLLTLHIHITNLKFGYFLRIIDLTLSTRSTQIVLPCFHFRWLFISYLTLFQNYRIEFLVYLVIFGSLHGIHFFRRFATFVGNIIGAESSGSLFFDISILFG